VEKINAIASVAKKIANSRNGIRRRKVGTPPPPRSIGIIELGENLEKILELQSLAGKILGTKDLAARSRAFVMGFCVLSGSWFLSVEVKVI
jgi:hypothetical protein